MASLCYRDITNFQLIKISLYHFIVSYSGNKTSSLYKGKYELNLSMRSHTYATRVRVCGMSTRRGVRLDKLAALNLMSFIPQSGDVDVAASTRTFYTRVKHPLCDEIRVDSALFDALARDVNLTLIKYKNDFFYDFILTFRNMI